jgi:hypothetical protein
MCGSGFLLHISSIKLLGIVKGINKCQAENLPFIPQKAIDEILGETAAQLLGGNDDLNLLC